MMRKAAKAPSSPPTVSGGAEKAAGEWEVRPGGMLVQKRTSGDLSSTAAAAVAVPNVRVKVKYGSSYHEIYLSSQATFGELKKRMAERTGLHPGDQKVVFKDKERDSIAYLDISGVKDGSKMVLLEDPAAQAKRLLEARRQAKADKAAKSIASIGVEVDRLASQVTALEAIVSRGGKVVEDDLLTLIEKLMTQLVKLDGVVVDGDAKQQRGMQVRRVQRYVEKLDLLKIKNAANRRSGLQANSQTTTMQHENRRQQPPAVVTTKWETFDCLLTPSSSTALGGGGGGAAPTPRFEWELF